MQESEFLSLLYKGGRKVTFPILNYIDSLWEQDNYQVNQINYLLNKIEVENLDTWASVALLSALNATHILHPIQDKIYNHIYFIAPDRARDLLEGFQCFRTKNYI